METIFKFFESLFKDFTWSRFTFLVFVFVATAAGLYFYESYTNHFKLSRMQEEIKVVNQIADLEKRLQEQKDSTVLKSYIAKLKLTLEEQAPSINPYQPFSNSGIGKLFLQSLPWLIFLVVGTLATKDGRGAFIGGCVVIALPLIAIGYYLPMPENEWLVNYLYPWGSFGAVIILILFLQRRAI